MPIITRGFDDLLIDSIKTALETFSTAQAVMTAAAKFNVSRDYVRAVNQNELPLVNINCGSITPQGFESRQSARYTAVINIDCYAKSNEDITGINDDKGYSRLYYLKHQVLYALFDLINSDFGFSAGIICSKKWPTWTPYNPSEKETEEILVAGRWSMEIEYEFNSKDIPDIGLETIEVTVSKDSIDMWKAQYNY